MRKLQHRVVRINSTRQCEWCGMRPDWVGWTGPCSGYLQQLATKDIVPKDPAARAIQAARVKASNAKRRERAAAEGLEDPKNAYERKRRAERDGTG